MGRVRNRQSGFSAIEGILVVLVIAIIGFGGYYVLQSQKKTVTDTAGDSTSEKATSQGTQAPTTGPYAGWKVGTLKYEKITYYYPSDWTVTDLSTALPKSKDGCTYPGQDYVYLTSPSKEQVSFVTGIDCIGDGSSSADGAVPITSLGQNQYLVFEGSAACLSKTSNPQGPYDGQSKNIFETAPGTDPGFPVNEFCYYPYMLYTKAGGSTTPTESATAIRTSADFAAAKLIFESMKY